MLLHYIICLCVGLYPYVYVCVNVGAHDLPACTASTLELYHAIVLGPHERGPVCNGSGVDDNCYIECTGEMTAINITSDSATRGCLYFARMPRLMRRRVSACVHVGECLL